MGRKSADEDIESRLTLIVSMLKDNLTDKEIAENLGISLSTWRRKKSQNNKIKAAIEEISDERNHKVEEKLFKNCIGYYFDEEVATKIKNETKHDDGSVTVNEDVKITKVRKYSKPDLAAQKYWLNNKKKAVWKEDPHKVENDKKLTKLKEKEVKSKIIE